MSSMILRRFDRFLRKPKTDEGFGLGLVRGISQSWEERTKMANLGK
jgi:hypothetical protein